MPKVQKQFLVDEEGRKTAVLLPLEEYEEMLKTSRIWR